MLNYEDFKMRMLNTADIFAPERFQGWKAILITDNHADHTVDYLAFASDRPNAASPCICIQEAYDVYKERGEMSDAYLYAVDSLIYEEMKIDDLDLIGNWHYCKTRVLQRLIAPDDLKKLPKNVICKDFLDLKVIYQIYIKKAENQIQPVIVTNHVLQNWSVSKEEVDVIAHANTLAMTSYQYVDMLDLLRHLAIQEEWPYEEFEVAYQKAKKRAACYSLWDKNHVCGSTLLMANPVLKDMADRMEGNLYVFATSDAGVDVADANNMTKEDAFEYLDSVIHRVGMDQEKRLSRSLYYYDAKSDSVSIVGRK